MKKAAIWLCIFLLAMTLPQTAHGAEQPEILIPVTVLAEGSTADPQTVYAVELIPQTPGCPMPEGSEAGKFVLELTSGSTQHFRIPCDALGVYDYTIRQQLKDIPGCIYDSQAFRMRLIVMTNEDGTRAASALIYGQEGSKQPVAFFRNRWPEPVSVVLNALKTLDGETPADGRFSFRLLNEDGTLIQEQKNDGRHIVFAPLYFEKEGTYRYFLKEVSGTEGKIQYDRTVYTVIVEVTADPEYKANVSYLRNGKPFSGTPAFANYTDTGSPKTGDTIGRWVAVLALSTVGLITLRKKRRS